MEEKRCEKCGHFPAKKEKNKIPLCEICYQFSPDKDAEFRDYTSEKIDGKLLGTFRKYLKTPGQKQKGGMIRKASEGELMSRVPFGYKLEEGKLAPAQNHREVEEVFEDFLNSGISLRQLAKKHGLSVNGLKKVLRNFTYLGKIKFNNQTYEGAHQPIVSSTLFNHVQDKLEKMKIK